MSLKLEELLIPKGTTYAEGIESYKRFFTTDLTDYLEEPKKVKNYWEQDENAPFILDCLNDEDKLPYSKEQYSSCYEKGEPISAELIEQIDKDGNLELPEELKKLYRLGVPSFGDFDDGRFTIFTPKLSSFFYDAMGNCGVDDIALGCEDEAGEYEVAEEDLEEIKKRFFFWGGMRICSCSEGSINLSYYDRINKKFGYEFFNFEEQDCMADTIKSLLEGGCAENSLDDEICEQLNETLRDMGMELKLTDDLWI